MNLKKAEQLALRLMRQHDLVAWEFGFDRATVRFGCCHYGKRKITLSKYLVALNTEAQVRDVILHEIAHALVGKAHGHDQVWKAKAVEIGARPERCYDTREIRMPLRRYTVTCPTCERSFQAAKKRWRVACAFCCREHNAGRYSARHALVFEKNQQMRS